MVDELHAAEERADRYRSKLEAGAVVLRQILADHMDREEFDEASDIEGVLEVLAVGEREHRLECDECDDDGAPVDGCGCWCHQ